MKPSASPKPSAPRTRTLRHVSDETPRCPCGKPRRSSGNGYYGATCASCYARRYRATPRGKERTLAANYAYIKRNPEKHRRWARTWRERVGWYVPDIQLLRSALKTLEASLAEAARRESLRSSSESRGDDGLER